MPSFTQPPKIAVGTEPTYDDWNARTHVISETVFCRVSNNWSSARGDWIVITVFTWDGEDPATIQATESFELSPLADYVDIRFASDGDTILENELVWQPLAVKGGVHYAVCWHPVGDSSGIGTKGEDPRIRVIKWSEAGGLQIQTKAEAFRPTVPYDYASDWLPGRMVWQDPDTTDVIRLLVVEGVWYSPHPYVLLRELFFDLATETWSQGATETIFTYSEHSYYADPLDYEPYPMVLTRTNGVFMLRMGDLYGGPMFIVRFNDDASFSRVGVAFHESTDDVPWYYVYSSPMPDGRICDALIPPYADNYFQVRVYGLDGAVSHSVNLPYYTDDYEMTDGVMLRAWASDQIHVFSADWYNDRLIVLRYDISGTSMTGVVEGFIDKPTEYPDGSGEKFWHWAGKWGNLGRHVGYTRQTDSSGPDAYDNVDLGAVIYVSSDYVPRSINARSSRSRARFQRIGRTN